MPLLDVARRYYAAQQSLTRRAVSAAQAAWSGLDLADLSASWAGARIGDRLYVATSQAQMLAAQLAEAYVAAALAEQDGDGEVLGVLVHESLAGVASDGRDLDDLLFQPVITTKAYIGGGEAPERAVEMGGAALARIVGTQVADAGRAAAGAAIVARPTATGYVRMLVPPSCGRCAVLAGRRYRWNADFRRHPLCDCVAVPAVEDAADDIRTDPQAYFDSLSAEDQARYFTVAGARAIRDGADIGQVVNARRGASGLSSPGRLTEAEQRVLRGGRGRGALQRVDVYGRQLAVTSEGVTTRGKAGQDLARAGGTTRDRGARTRRAKTPRLMPEAIYELAGDDRDEAVRLLRRFGYIAG